MVCNILGAENAFPDPELVKNAVEKGISLPLRAAQPIVAIYDSVQGVESAGSRRHERSIHIQLGLARDGIISDGNEHLAAEEHCGRPTQDERIRVQHSAERIQRGLFEGEKAGSPTGRTEDYVIGAEPGSVYAGIAIAEIKDALPNARRGSVPGDP